MNAEIVSRGRLARDLSYIFTSNHCIDKYSEDATNLNLKKAAEYLCTKVRSGNTTNKLYEVRSPDSM